MLKVANSVISASRITGVLPVANGGTGVTTSTGTGNTVLSATPTLSGNVTLSTGNLIVASGQGIDFSATSGAGTSELLADYEEGTFSPRFAGTTAAGTWGGFGYGTYRKVGKIVTIWWEISQDASNQLVGATGDLIITNLPFSQADERGGISYSVFANLNLSALANALYGYVTGANIVLSIGTGGNTFTAFTITTNLTSSSVLYGSAVYSTAA